MILKSFALLLSCTVHVANISSDGVHHWNHRGNYYNCRSDCCTDAIFNRKIWMFKKYAQTVLYLCTFNVYYCQLVTGDFQKVFLISKSFNIITLGNSCEMCYN